MGCGKSTVGSALADKLDWQHIDTDMLIAKRFEMDIPTIFKTYGEARFREAEIQVLEDVIESEDVVISTGGGLPCNDKAIDMINQYSHSYYLYMSAHKLSYRLWNKELADTRPLLKSLNSREELSEFVKNKLLLRERYYYDSRGIIDAHQAVEAVVDDLISAIEPNVL